MKMKFPYLSGSLSPRNRPRKLVMFAVSIAFVLTALLASGGLVKTVSSQDPATDPTIDELRNKAIKGPLTTFEMVSSGGGMALFGPGKGPDDDQPGNNNAQPGAHDNGRGGNSYVNDPCLDPPTDAPFPGNFRGVVQSETEIAVLNTQGSMGKKMIAGYNDSLGFYDNRQGLSGYAYSTNGGNTWIDGGGLPPRIPAGAPAGARGQDAYFGDPVLVVHHQTQTFYYASIYQSNAGYFTLVVNKGVFAETPPPGTLPTVTESRSNTRCLNNPDQQGIRDEPKNQQERVYWFPPVEAIIPPTGGQLNDLLDKEWLYVDQRTGTLYMSYTRFENAPTFGTPIELVRCVGCAFKPGPLTTADWQMNGTTIIVPNEDFDFNQATQPFTTPTGRVIVAWVARRFNNIPPFQEIQNRIEYAFSDGDGAPGTFSPELVAAVVNPQGEPPGYNRGRTAILNAPYLMVDKGEDDGVDTPAEMSRPGFGNVYITYFSGRTPFGVTPRDRAGDIFLSTSRNNGTTFDPPVKVNDDDGTTSHIFPSVQANKHGYVYVTWLDRRFDPLNRLTNTWAAVSQDLGLTFGHNKVQTDVATDWFTREDSRPDYGDYNSSELLGFNQFVIIWADGRFPPGTFLDVRPPAPPPTTQRRAATPDTIFTIANGLGVGEGGKQ
ncbi:MAG: hypothetical protein H0V18_06850 [Pyrinomonadaceae bacterium]|nr:hypothetical protein [Pyrinomonadaceae bacterium]